MNTSHFRPLITAAVVSLTLGACGGAPKQVDSLEKARADYKAISDNETVVKHAPEELDQARDALKLADRQWRNEEDSASVEHYAYLANQRISIANLIAESNETDRKLEDMALQRRNVSLDLREADLIKARQDAEKMQREMKELQAEKTERGMVLTLGDVLFSTGKAILAPGAARNIGKVASFLRNNPERNAVIEGHTDSMGDEDFNMGLSRDRAFAVQAALVEAGVSSRQLSTQGFGESLPVATNASAAGRQKNRRVEIIFPSAKTQISEYED